MKIILFNILILFSMTATVTVFDFNSRADAAKWRITDDVVMGGRSNGDFSVVPQ